MSNLCDCFICNSSDEESEWQEVYNTPEEFGKYIPEGNIELEPLRNGIYYQTGGGGPESGLVVIKGAIYSVERNWGNPFTAYKLIDKALIYRVGDEMKGIVPAVLIH